MARRQKPRLVQIGNGTFVDPNDVAAIVKLRKFDNLYVIRLKSQPDSAFPLWVKEAYLGPLLEEFNLIVTDVVEHEDDGQE